MTDSINWCDLKKNAKHIGEVSTSRSDGNPTGAEILTSTNEVTGQVRDTLDGKFKKMDDAFNSITSSQFIVTNFGNWSTVAGQQIVVGDELKGYQYPDDSGDVYAVKGSVTLPITRPSSPVGDDRFYLASAVNEARLKEVTDSVNNLHTNRNAIEWSAGLNVTDPLQLYMHADIEYLPKASKVPFTTGVSFDDSMFSIFTKDRTYLTLRTYGSVLNNVYVTGRHSNTSAGSGFFHRSAPAQMDNDGYIIVDNYGTCWVRDESEYETRLDWFIDENDALNTGIASVVQKISDIKPGALKLPAWTMKWESPVVTTKSLAISGCGVSTVILPDFEGVCITFTEADENDRMSYVENLRFKGADGLKIPESIIKVGLPQYVNFKVRDVSCWSVSCKNSIIDNTRGYGISIKNSEFSYSKVGRGVVELRNLIDESNYTYVARIKDTDFTGCYKLNGAGGNALIIDGECELSSVITEDTQGSGIILGALDGDGGYVPRLTIDGWYAEACTESILTVTDKTDYAGRRANINIKSARLNVGNGAPMNLGYSTVSFSGMTVTAGYLKLQSNYKSEVTMGIDPFPFENLSPNKVIIKNNNYEVEGVGTNKVKLYTAGVNNWRSSFVAICNYQGGSGDATATYMYQIRLSESNDLVSIKLISKDVGAGVSVRDDMFNFTIEDSFVNVACAVNGNWTVKTI